MKQKIGTIQFLNFSPDLSSGRVSKFLARYRFLFLVMVIVGILMDVFLLKSTSDLIVLLLTALWIGTVIGWRWDGKASFLGALIFLTICPFLLILGKEFIAEKAAVWAYMFLVVGTIQMFIEDRNQILDNLR